AVLFLNCTIAVAQKDSTSRVTDSVNNLLLLQQSKQLQQLENKRLVDSLKKMELQAQLREVKSDDNAKRQELKDQLDAIAYQDSLRLTQKEKKIDSLRNYVTGYGVAPFYDDTLFFVYARLGSFGPDERAEAIVNRLRKVAKNSFGAKDSLKIVPNEQTIDIYSGENIIMSISDDDALWANSSKAALANKYKEIFSKSITSYRSDFSWQSILKEVLLSLVVLGLLITIIFLINRLKRKVKFYIIKQKGHRVKGIKIRNYVLFDADREASFLFHVNNALRWLLVIMAIYISLPILFSIFPGTKGVADTLFGYFLSPVKKILNSIWHFLPNLFTIIVIVIVFNYLLKGLHFLKNEVECGDLKINGFYPDWANPTYQIIKILVLSFMLIVIFPYLPGSESPAFKGVSVFLGVLFTFGSAGSLSNIIAGLVLTYMRAFKIGDRVKIGDITGDIIEKTLLVTRIRTIKNEINSIPNSNVMSSHTTNYSSDAPDKGLIIHTTVTIGYDVPWRQVHQLLIDAALATDLVVKEHSPFVLQTSLDDFYVSYQVNAYTKEPNKQAIIYSNLHQNIQDKFNQAGVEIMSPHYGSLRDGNTTTIPPGHLPKDYKAPSFKIKKEEERNKTSDQKSDH
ncbi:MAG: mechanosensitive ion channel family protein, partial [Ginsengibacter sp.]